MTTTDPVPGIKRALLKSASSAALARRNVSASCNVSSPLPAEAPSPGGGRHRAADETDKRLLQGELAKRWRISPRTLERWRWLKQGPAFLRIGGRIAYKIEDIEAFEAQQRVCNARAVERR